jgi:hypothetical protein
MSNLLVDPSYMIFGIASLNASKVSIPTNSQKKPNYGALISRPRILIAEEPMSIN